MTDRELLELAAKAAGYAKAKFQDISGWGEARYGLSEAMFVPEIEDYWNPLVDSGHALRLAVRLRMSIEISDCQIYVRKNGSLLWNACALNDVDSEILAATRRAVVCAAAEIGKASS